MKHKYVPERGDIVYINFNPIKGHEQAGRRPALIISTKVFSQKTGLSLLCPISNSKKTFPLHVSLNNLNKTTGKVLCEHIRSIDYNAREIEYVEKISSEVMEDVMKIINIFFN